MINYLDIIVLSVLVIAVILLILFGKKKIVNPILDRLFVYIVEEVERRISERNRVD